MRERGNCSWKMIVLIYLAVGKCSFSPCSVGDEKLHGKQNFVPLLIYRITVAKNNICVSFVIKEVIVMVKGHIEGPLMNSFSRP